MKFSYQISIASRLKTWLAMVFFFLLTEQVFSQQYDIHGKIVEAQSSSPVANVNITILNSKTGTASDANGYFSLRLPAGSWHLQFNHIGYAPTKQRIVVPGDSVLSIRLRVRPYQAPGIVVSSPRIDEKIAGHPFRLDARSLANAPALGDPDPFRAATLLPGVVSVNDLKGEIHIRGGASDQNIISLDGMEIQQPFHLLGVVGSFNIDALQSIELYTGPLPVDFSDKLSGALVLKTRESEQDRQTKARVSLLASSLTTEKRWSTGRVLFSVRRTYFDLLARLFSSSALNYSFYDGHVHFTQKLAKNWRVNAVGFLSRDRFNPFTFDKFEGGTETDDDPDAQDVWGNTSWGVQLAYTGKSFLWRNQATFSQNFNRFDGADNDVAINNTLRDTQLKSHLEWHGSDISVVVGAFYRPLQFKYAWYGEKNQDTLEEIFYIGVPDSFQMDLSTSIAGGYGSIERNLHTRVSAKFGLRVTANSTSQIALLPRFSLNAQLHDNLLWRVSYGTHAQWFGAGVETRETSIGSPLFPTAQPLQASLVSAGLELKATDTIDGHLRFDFFDKQFKRINRLAESSDYPVFEYGTGSVHGFDIFYLKNRGKVTSQLGYTFQRVRHDFFGESYTPAWAIEHAFSGMLGLQIGKGWSLHTTLLIQSGAPFTPVAAYVPILSNTQGGNPNDPFIWLPVIGATNSARLPAYWRTDVLFRKQWLHGTRRYEVYLQIINLFFHKNVLRQTADILTPASEQESYLRKTGLPILPSVGFSITF